MQAKVTSEIFCIIVDWFTCFVAPLLALATLQPDFFKCFVDALFITVNTVRRSFVLFRGYYCILPYWFLFLVSEFFFLCDSTPVLLHRLFLFWHFSVLLSFTSCLFGLQLLHKCSFIRLAVRSLATSARRFCGAFAPFGWITFGYGLIARSEIRVSNRI